MLRSSFTARLLGLFVLVVVFAPPTAAYTGGSVSNGGSIKGTIKAPPRADETLTIAKDTGVCGDSMPAEKYLISAEGGVKNAVVKIGAIEAGKAFEAQDEYAITNDTCRFSPHVMIAPQGGTMTTRNADPLLHNSHFYLLDGETKKNVINLALPKQGMAISKPKILRKPGLLSVQCDAHDFMQGWVWVLENPYAAVTGADGSFEIVDVPAGTHKLTIWHEALGEKTVDVTVKAGGTASVEVSY